MDMEYGINIKNKYDCLLDDDNDPEETVAGATARAIVEAENREKEALKAAKKAKEDAKKAEKVEKQTPPPSSGKENRPDGGQGQRGRGGPGFRGNRGVGRGAGGPRPPRDSQEGEVVDGGGDGNENAQRPRGGGAPRGEGFRGSRGGAGRGRGGVREFRRGGGSYNAGGAPYVNGEQVENADGLLNQSNDSQNATNNAAWGVGGDQERPPRDFRGGRGGSGSYMRGGRGRGEGDFGGLNRRGRGDRHSGSDRTGVKSTEKRQGAGRGNWGTVNDELVGETETPVAGEEKVPEGDGEGEQKEEAPKVPPQPEEKVMTLDEWKRAQAPKDTPQFNVRKPIEAKGGKVLASKYDDQHEEETIIVEKRPLKKTVIPLDFKSATGDSQGYRGGDRDGFRGGRGRGGGDRPDFRGGRGGRGGARGGRGGGSHYNHEGGASTKRDVELNLEEFPALG